MGVTLYVEVNKTWKWMLLHPHTLGVGSWSHTWSSTSTLTTITVSIERLGHKMHKILCVDQPRLVGFVAAM